MSSSNFNRKGIHLKASQKVKRMTYHDLDHLAGSWSSTDEKIFKKNTKYFEKIDAKLWIAKKMG